MPAAGGGALQRCVACGSDRFGADYWGRAPLLTRAAELGRGFDDLLDLAAVDELVSRRGLRTPFLRMAKDGAVLPAARFTRGVHNNCTRSADPITASTRVRSLSAVR